jgi:hypothetical protein
MTVGSGSTSACTNPASPISYKSGVQALGREPMPPGAGPYRRLTVKLRAGPFGSSGQRPATPTRKLPDARV